jgi:Rrf2 family protein
MKYSTRTRYGLRLLVFLAKRGDKAYVQLREIQEKEAISLRYLEQIVRLLKPAGLLDSTRGKNGGYRLAKPPEEINLAEIVGFLEGDLAPISCLVPERECARRPDCPTLPMWLELQELIKNFLRNKYLADMI